MIFLRSTSKLNALAMRAPQTVLNGCSSALMGTADSPCLAALSGQPPRPAGSRRKARGVDGESACRATMCPSHYAANISAVLLILFLSPRWFVDVAMTFLQLTTKAEPPFAMRHSPHQLISGRDGGPAPRSLLQQCEGTGAPRKMGPFSLAAYCSQSAFTVTHLPWNR